MCRLGMLNDTACNGTAAHHSRTFSDDYYLVFLNVTHGVVYSISDKFTILPPSGTSANTSQQVGPDTSKPTVTVTGSPGPFMVRSFLPLAMKVSAAALTQRHV